MLHPAYLESPPPRLSLPKCDHSPQILRPAGGRACTWFAPAAAPLSQGAWRLKRQRYGAWQHDSLQDDGKDEDILSEFRPKTDASPPRAAAAGAAAAAAVPAAVEAAAGVAVAPESNSGMDAE
jgi:hypothetical protein